MLKITSGAWRGRLLQTPATTQTRPTANRIREAIFNVLRSRFPESLDNTHVADICCGSGALGFEALSNGASHCTFIDESNSAIRCVQHNASTLQCHAAIQTLASRAEHAQPLAAPYHLVLADPPYHDTGIFPILRQWQQNGWLAPEHVIVLETASTTPVPPHTVMLQKQYGITTIHYLRLPQA